MKNNIGVIGLCAFISALALVTCAIVTFRAIKEDNTDRAILFGGLTVLNIYCLCVHLSKLLIL